MQNLREAWMLCTFIFFLWPLVNCAVRRGVICLDEALIHALVGGVLAYIVIAVLSYLYYTL
jgi:hypothetical protein